MAIREIRVVPDPVLRTPCDPIREITPAVRHLVQDAGYGFDIPDFVRSSWISVIGSLLLVVLVWAIVLMRWGQA